MHLYLQLLSRDPLVTITELQNVNVFDTLPYTLSTEATAIQTMGHIQCQQGFQDVDKP